LNRKEDQPTQSIAIARRRLFWAHQVYIGWGIPKSPGQTPDSRDWSRLGRYTPWWHCPSPVQSLRPGQRDWKAYSILVFSNSILEPTCLVLLHIPSRMAFPHGTKGRSYPRRAPFLLLWLRQGSGE
jgi:hypothetical protein